MPTPCRPGKPQSVFKCGSNSITAYDCKTLEAITQVVPPRGQCEEVDEPECVNECDEVCSDCQKECKTDDDGVVIDPALCNQCKTNRELPLTKAACTTCLQEAATKRAANRAQEQTGQANQIYALNKTNKDSPKDLIEEFSSTKFRSVEETYQEQMSKYVKHFEDEDVVPRSLPSIQNERQQRCIENGGKVIGIGPGCEMGERGEGTLHDCYSNAAAECYGIFYDCIFSNAVYENYELVTNVPGIGIQRTGEIAAENIRYGGAEGCKVAYETCRDTAVLQCVCGDCEFDSCMRGCRDTPAVGGGGVNASDPETPTANQEPGINNVRFTQSSYGIPIPVVWGTYIVTGNVVWLGNIRKSTYQIIEESRKETVVTQVVTNKPIYRGDLCIALCRGPIEGISRIWFGETLIYNNAEPSGSGEIDNLLLYSSSENDKGFYDASRAIVTLLDGSEDANFAPEGGVAYRGTACVLISNLNLSYLNGQLPDLKVEVVVKREVTDSFSYANNTQLVDANTLISDSPSNTLFALKGDSTGLVLYNKDTLNFVDDFDFEDAVVAASLQVLPDQTILVQHASDLSLNLYNLNGIKLATFPLDQLIVKSIALQQTFVEVLTLAELAIKPFYPYEAFFATGGLYQFLLKPIGDNAIIDGFIGGELINIPPYEICIANGGNACFEQFPQSGGGGDGEGGEGEGGGGSGDFSQELLDCLDANLAFCEANFDENEVGETAKLVAAFVDKSTYTVFLQPDVPIINRLNIETYSYKNEVSRLFENVVTRTTTVDKTSWGNVPLERVVAVLKDGTQDSYVILAETAGRILAFGYNNTLSQTTFVTYYDGLFPDVVNLNGPIRDVVTRNYVFVDAANNTVSFDFASAKFTLIQSATVLPIVSGAQQYDPMSGALVYITPNGVSKVYLSRVVAAYANVADICTDVSVYSGIADSFVESEEIGQVYGYAVTALNNATGPIKQLSTLFNFSAYEDNGNINFFKPNADSTYLVDNFNLTNQTGRVTLRTDGQAAIVDKVRLTYANPFALFAVAAQNVGLDTNRNVSKNVSTYETSAAFLVTEAQKVAETLLFNELQEKETITLTGVRRFTLTPNSVVTYENKNYRLTSLTEIDNTLTAEGVAYSPAIITDTLSYLSEDIPVGQTEYRSSGEVVPRVFSIPPITYSDEQASRSYYVFYVGVQDGPNVVYGQDQRIRYRINGAGSYELGGRVTQPLRTGRVTGALPTVGTPYSTDTKSALVIKFDRPPPLYTQDTVALYNEASLNLILVGRELIQFKEFTVDPSDPTLVTFRKLHRGVNGTEVFINEHSIGQEAIYITQESLSPLYVFYARDPNLKNIDLLVSRPQNALAPTNTFTYAVNNFSVIPRAPDSVFRADSSNSVFIDFEWRGKFELGDDLVTVTPTAVDIASQFRFQNQIAPVGQFVQNFVGYLTNLDFAYDEVVTYARLTEEQLTFSLPGPTVRLTSANTSFTFPSSSLDTDQPLFLYLFEVGGPQGNRVGFINKTQFPVRTYPSAAALPNVNVKKLSKYAVLTVPSFVRMYALSAATVLRPL